jgi:hypothetical protein
MHFQELFIKEQIAEQRKHYHEFISDRTLFDMLALSYYLPNYIELKKIVDEYYKERKYNSNSLYDLVFYFPIEFEIEDD